MGKNIGSHSGILERTPSKKVNHFTSIKIMGTTEKQCFSTGSLLSCTFWNLRLNNTEHLISGLCRQEIQRYFNFIHEDHLLDVKFQILKSAIEDISIVTNQTEFFCSELRKSDAHTNNSTNKHLQMHVCPINPRPHTSHSSSLNITKDAWGFPVQLPKSIQKTSGASWPWCRHSAYPAPVLCLETLYHRAAVVSWEPLPCLQRQSASLLKSGFRAEQN